MSIAGAIEAAEAEYLRARVVGLLGIEGNPHGAAVRTEGPLQGFLVGSTTSPMVNRICGDPAEAPEELAALLAWFVTHGSQAAIPRIFHDSKPQANATVGLWKLRRLNGWTHIQLAAGIDHATVLQSSVLVDEMTSKSVDAFADLHAEAFNTPKAAQALNRASFASLLAGGHARGFLVHVAHKPVAGAMVYFAENGVAYLGTAVTRRGERGNGYHSALIGCRIIAARENGSRFVAATATPNSQSRRNLERFGLQASHTQTLYNAEQSEGSV